MSVCGVGGFMVGGEEVIRWQKINIIIKITQTIIVRIKLEMLEICLTAGLVTPCFFYKRKLNAMKKSLTLKFISNI